MNIFGIGLPEMAVIAAIGLLVFGPKRLPELGKTLGKTLKGFQSASQEFEKELRTAMSSEVVTSSEAALSSDTAAKPPSAAITPSPVPPSAASAAPPSSESESGDAHDLVQAAGEPEATPPA